MSRRLLGWLWRDRQGGHCGCVIHSEDQDRNRSHKENCDNDGNCTDRRTPLSDIPGRQSPAGSDPDPCTSTGTSYQAPPRRSDHGSQPAPKLGSTLHGVAYSRRSRGLAEVGQAAKLGGEAGGLAGRALSVGTLGGASGPGPWPRRAGGGTTARGRPSRVGPFVSDGGRDQQRCTHMPRVGWSASGHLGDNLSVGSPGPRISNRLPSTPTLEVLQPGGTANPDRSTSATLIQSCCRSMS